jgi:hypothetical protein
MCTSRRHNVARWIFGTTGRKHVADELIEKSGIHARSMFAHRISKLAKLMFFIAGTTRQILEAKLDGEFEHMCANLCERIMPPQDVGLYAQNRGPSR